jgi:hypothetical protein
MTAVMVTAIAGLPSYSLNLFLHAFKSTAPKMLGRIWIPVYINSTSPSAVMRKRNPVLGQVWRQSQHVAKGRHVVAHT